MIKELIGMLFNVKTISISLITIVLTLIIALIAKKRTCRGKVHTPPQTKPQAQAPPKTQSVAACPLPASKVYLTTEEIVNRYIEQVQLPLYMKVKYPMVLRWEFADSPFDRQGHTYLNLVLYYANGYVGHANIARAEIQHWNGKGAEVPHTVPAAVAWLENNSESLEKRMKDCKEEKLHVTVNGLAAEDIEQLCRLIEQRYGKITSRTEGKEKEITIEIVEELLN